MDAIHTDNMLRVLAAAGGAAVAALLAHRLYPQDTHTAHALLALAAGVGGTLVSCNWNTHWDMPISWDFTSFPYQWSWEKFAMVSAGAFAMYMFFGTSDAMEIASTTIGATILTTAYY